MTRRTIILASILVVVVLVAVVFVLPRGEVGVTDVVEVARLTGSGSINRTYERWGVAGTDLGTMWDDGRGGVLLAFGDTFANVGTGDFGPGDADWRSNVLARSSDRDFADGLMFDSMVEGLDGHAKELLHSQKRDGVEMTVIPTAGVAVGDRQYMHYMSVNHWGEPGEWFTNYGGIAYSDDDGATWTMDPRVRWTNNAAWSDHFQMVAFAKDGGYVYMWGTPNGRSGSVYLARVAEAHVLRVGDYEYWDGATWQRDAPQAAMPVIPAPVGELSVAYNSYLGRWIALNFDADRYALVLRDAPAPTGPWSEPKVVATGVDYPLLYGGYIHPWSTDGPDMYFTLSRWGPYNVFLMRASLTRCRVLGVGC